MFLFCIEVRSVTCFFFSLVSFCFRYITKQTAFSQCDKPTGTVHSVHIFHRPVKQHVPGSGLIPVLRLNFIYSLFSWVR